MLARQKNPAQNNYFPFIAQNAQKRYCRETGLPMRAPEGGICPHCVRNIYMAVVRIKDRDVGRTLTTGISVERAESEHIIQCPHCGEML